MYGKKSAFLIFKLTGTYFKLGYSSCIFFTRIVSYVDGWVRLPILLWSSTCIDPSNEISWRVQALGSVSVFTKRPLSDLFVFIKLYLTLQPTASNGFATVSQLSEVDKYKWKLRLLTINLAADFPNECLEDIFRHFSGAELLKFTLLHPELNEYIGSTRSCMQKIVISALMAEIMSQCPWKTF